MPLPLPSLDDVLTLLRGGVTQLAKRTLEGASEAVLDEIQGALRAADDHIAGARSRVRKKRGEVEVIVVKSVKKKRARRR